MTRAPIFAPILAIAFLATFASACQTTGPADPAALQSAPSEANNAPAFVAAVCGDCHAVAPPFESPVAEAPTFAAIANRDGVTHPTLSRWLLDAHNYPLAMEFSLSEKEAGAAAKYMLTLRRADYVPAP